VGTAPALHDYREGCPESQRPAQKWALPHPVYGTSGSLMTQSEGLTERFLYVYDQHQLAGSTQIPKFVALGSPDSLRRVLSCERMITGEYLFTIKARHALGVLPEVNSDAVPPSGREKVIALLDKLVDAAYRGSPDSIIDRAGDTAQWCLATWLVSRSTDDSLFKKDFSQLIAKVKAEPRLIIPQAAENPENATCQGQAKCRRTIRFPSCYRRRRGACVEGGRNSYSRIRLGQARLA
jgi:hypothetical protein